MLGNLQHSPADIVRRLIVRAALGSAPELGGTWPVYASGEPHAPDHVITVYDTEGKENGRTMPDGEAQRHVGVQFRIRCTTHPLGYRKASDIRTYISEISYQESITLGDVAYLVRCFSSIGQVLSLGKDVPNSSRVLFTLNAMVVIEQR